MSKSLIARLARAIGYPQEVSAEAESFVFLVDGHEIAVRTVDGGFELCHTLLSTDEAARSEGTVARLSGFAAGRLLKEDATLAWDPDAGAVILWTLVKAEGEGDLRRVFGAFCESVDWWSDRVDEEDLGLVGVPEMVIRP